MNIKQISTNTVRQDKGIFFLPHSYTEMNFSSQTSMHVQHLDDLETQFAFLLQIVKKH